MPEHNMTPEPPSAWAPLRERAFLWMWAATVLSNTGTWMNDVGAAWLMTELAPSPAMVALIQSASTLPVFCFALLAGVLTDRWDRRRLLLGVNTAMAMLAGLMALLVSAHAMTPVLLLTLTFLLNTGAAFIAPVWLAVVPSLVARSDLPAALALNSLGINISRAIGPSLAGVVIVTFGLWSPFTLNALSFLGILAAISLWRAPKRPKQEVTSSMRADMREGLHYALTDPEFRAILIRVLGFFAFASAGWALLPIVARDVLRSGATGYGLMMGAIGAGAVLSAVFLPWVRKRYRPALVVDFGAVLVAFCLIGLAVSNVLFVTLLVCFGIGMAWIAVLSSFHVAVQTTVPDELRGRGISVFLMVFFGAMAAFSAVWGILAAALSTPFALVASAILGVSAGVCLKGWQLPGLESA